MADQVDAVRARLHGLSRDTARLGMRVEIKAPGIMNAFRGPRTGTLTDIGPAGVTVRWDDETLLLRDRTDFVPWGQLAATGRAVG